MCPSIFKGSVERSTIAGTVCKNSLILFCEASACCIIEVSQPTIATGQVSYITILYSTSFKAE
jgi:hypothetical protein